MTVPAAGHAPVRGALWMIGAGVCFAFGNSLLRYLTGVMHPYEVAFFQYGLALLILLPWVLVRGMASVRAPAGRGCRRCGSPRRRSGFCS